MIGDGLPVVHVHVRVYRVHREALDQFLTRRTRIKSPPDLNWRRRSRSRYSAAESELLAMLKKPRQKRAVLAPGNTATARGILGPFTQLPIRRIPSKAQMRVQSSNRIASIPDQWPPSGCLFSSSVISRSPVGLVRRE
ncbi:hypothetical protein [Nitrosospira sp. Is2]